MDCSAGRQLRSSALCRRRPSRL